MRKSRILAGAASAIILAASSMAHAAPCEGINARKYEKPLPVHKGKDKSTTYLLKSAGVSSRKTPDGEAQDGSFQHCTGLWTVNADKSGSGSGSCLSVDKNGDYRVTFWTGSKTADKGAKASGTWVRNAGTGKYTGDHMAQGTWTSTVRLPEGYQVGNWKSTCQD